MDQVIYMPAVCSVCSRVHALFRGSIHGLCARKGSSMTLDSFYAQIGGNYQQILQRLYREALIRKFVLKYQTDPTYRTLGEALTQSDWETAFRAAHTLKGIALNLGFDRLYASSSALTEALRGPKPLKDFSLWTAVQSTQQEIISAIRALDQ